MTPLLILILILPVCEMPQGAINKNKKRDRKQFDDEEEERRSELVDSSPQSFEITHSCRYTLSHKPPTSRNFYTAALTGACLLIILHTA